MEKLSLASSLIIIVISAYSYIVTPLYVPSFGLAKIGYLIGVLIPAISLYLLHQNEKKRSKHIAEAIIAINTPLFFFLVTPQSYTNNIFISSSAFITFTAAFTSSASSAQLLGFSVKKTALLFLVLAAMMLFVHSIYLGPSTDVARYSGTVLSDNWWSALNWIKNNTPECSIVATYWDPGHFIRAIAYRGVIFDGATQGATRTVPSPGHEDGLAIIPYENGIKHIILYKDGNATTSRINDIAISLMTSNESLAIEILDNYRLPGCDTMYYIASSDLIGKSVWWTYFSTWDPTVSKGTMYSYQIMNLGSIKPLPNQNALVYTYPIGQNQAFLLIGINNTLKPFLQQGNLQPIPVEMVIYYSDAGQVLFNRDPDAPVKGTILVQSDKQVAVYIPPELQNSMFTKLLLFNGAGLENFEFVNDWGGEVKLFKVNFTTPAQ